MFETLLGESGLSLDRLRNFLAVAEAGSISKAAQGDASRQALYSRQIRELETFFGTQLTERRGKGIVISRAGARLAALTREQLQGLEDFKHEQAHVAKQFVIGASNSILEWLVLPNLHEIVGHLDGAKLRVEAHRSMHLVEAIREGRLDFAIVRQDAVSASLPQASVAKKVDFYLCVPGKMVREHGTALLSQPRAWSTLPLVVPTTGGQFHETLAQSFEKHHVKLAPAVECHSFLHVRQLIETGHYAGVLPSWGVAGLEQSGVVLRTFAPLKDYGRPLCLHWNTRQMARRSVDARTLLALATILSRYSKRSLKHP
ncbi:LysR family transcriptional regulator [Roseimicrobium sp. ORNL1]|uniref:LysR family transcriptional regulator n=1 Tax=Roseimicrobium sp. ORNL1 TaxID=2711231 RepID=UPI0013E1CF35|nr:LysR family transcriptional regulator [Roseimicrobium sp. ORNL1]QIF03794.1 LysR family transcriptional regulator [Roseimicrobium sp. ORNL1]